MLDRPVACRRDRLEPLEGAVGPNGGDDVIDVRSVPELGATRDESAHDCRADESPGTGHEHGAHASAGHTYGISESFAASRSNSSGSLGSVAQLARMETGSAMP